MALAAAGGNLHQLRFRDSLNWTAGRPIQVKDLLSRLRSFANELASLEPEQTEKSALRHPAAQLANGQLLNHKDAGVKAWTAVCLVQILRVCVPDAPFNSTQLGDIFTFITNQILPNAADTTHAFAVQHRHVLKVLAETQSIVLMTDVSNSTNLIRKFFLTCFDMLSDPSQQVDPGNQLNIAGLLQCLIEESQVLPSEVVETILAQFLRADPRTSTFFAGRKGAVGDGSQKTPPSYNVASMICSSCSTTMAMHVAQYFSSVIVESASLDPTKAKSKRRAASDDSDDDNEKGPSEEDLKELDRAHRLLRELWRASPKVLQNVIPQIESELLTENINLRTLATETLGDMAAGIGAAPLVPQPDADPATYPERESSASDGIARAPEKFIRVHASVYQRFLTRQNDKHAPIRAVWTTAIGRILYTDAGGIGLTAQESSELVESLARMLVDSDEKVRVAAIQSIGLFDLEGIVSRFGSNGDLNKEGSLLKNLADRVREKKHTVRTEAAILLGKIWAMAAGSISTGKTDVRDLLGEIPSKIFDAYYINDRDIFALIDQILFDYFMPIAYPAARRKGAANADDAGAGALTTDMADKLRVERLLVLFSGLSQRAKPVLMRLMSRPTTIQNHVSVLLKRCEDYNGGVMETDANEIEQHLGRLINFFAKETTDAQRASEDLWRFAKLHDGRSYKLIRFCIAPESDYKKIVNSMKELKKRLENANFGASSVETVVAFVRRISNLYFNKSHIQPIISFTQTNGKGLAAAANDILVELTSKNPSAFKSHARELCRSLVDQAPSATRENSSTALDALKACAPFASKYPDDMPNDDEFQDALIEYAMRGTPAAAAKHAVSILMSISGDERGRHAKDLLQRCVKEFEYGTNNFLPRLACLSQLMLTSGQDLDEDLDPVIDIATNQTLLKIRNAHVEGDGSWNATVDEECEAKIWAVKILVNRIRPYTDAQAVRDIAKPVYQLLTTLVAKKGELSKKTPTPEAHKSRLRLQAALSLLKLSTNRIFDQYLTPVHFLQLALVAQDEIHPVRERFIRKLKKYLGQDRLSSRFYVMTFLLAFEPGATLKEETTTWLRARASVLARTNHMVLEFVFARFVSLLAHHPDFGRSTEDLTDFVRYILFYLKVIATEENLGVIYHVAQRVKSVQDGIDPETSENLYTLSDLAQAVIQSYEEAKGWSMQAYSGKAQMPVGIFTNLTSHEVAQDIASKTYLQSEMMTVVDDLVRAEVKTRSTRKRKSESTMEMGIRERPAKQRKSEATPKPGVTGRKSRTATKKKPRGARGQTHREEGDEAEGSDMDQSFSSSKTKTEPVPRRRSGRATGAREKNFAENSSSEIEEENDDDDDDDETDDEDREQDKEDDDDDAAAAAESDGTPAPKETSVGSNGDHSDVASAPEESIDIAEAEHKKSAADSMAEEHRDAADPPTHTNGSSTKQAASKSRASNTKGQTQLPSKATPTRASRRTRAAGKDPNSPPPASSSPRSSSAADKQGSGRKAQGQAQQQTQPRRQLPRRAGR